MCPWVLGGLPVVVARMLQNVLENSWWLGEVPEDQKKTNVTSVFRNGKDDQQHTELHLEESWWQGKGVIFPLRSAVVIPHLQCCVQTWALQCKRDPRVSLGKRYEHVLHKVRLQELTLLTFGKNCRVLISVLKCLIERNKRDGARLLSGIHWQDRYRHKLKYKKNIWFL